MPPLTRGHSGRRSRVRRRRVVGEGRRYAAAVPARRIGVRVVDARVDDGDLDALTVEAVEAVPYRRGADERHTADVVDGHRVDGPHGLNARQSLEIRRLRGRDPDLDAVVGELVVAEDLAAEALDRALDGVLLGLELALEGVLIALAQRVARIRVGDCDRIAGHLHHERLGRPADAERRHGGIDEPVAPGRFKADRSVRAAPGDRAACDGDHDRYGRCGHDKTQSAPGSSKLVHLPSPF